MTTLTVLIIVVFVVGYMFIALESITKVNKAAIALLMFVACWTLFMVRKHLNNVVFPHGSNDNC